ncbi:hypothetical protein CGLAMM_09535 [Acetobacteraceae bacterium EV16G]|uniref:Uncharacterized protein n=1 Tax=Sorlinia euscelidii TaxID=3081148 RepID=A0ABU7U3I1_9PROT
MISRRCTSVMLVWQKNFKDRQRRAWRFLAISALITQGIGTEKIM